MIPELPESCSDSERLAFYSDILSNLEDQSTIHVHWHTHKQNPSVCWICDIPICARKIAYIVEKNITKSTDRHSDSYSSDEESEAETDDEFFNKNDEESNPSDEVLNVPEYDVMDGPNASQEVEEN